MLEDDVRLHPDLPQVLPALERQHFRSLYVLYPPLVAAGEFESTLGYRRDWRNRLGRLLRHMPYGRKLLAWARRRMAPQTLEVR